MSNTSYYITNNIYPITHIYKKVGHSLFVN